MSVDHFAPKRGPRRPCVPSAPRYRHRDGSPARRALGVVMLLAILGVAGCTGPGRRSPTSGSREWQHVELGLCEEYPDDRRSLEGARRDFEQMRACAVNVLRVGMAWDSIEPERGRFDWTFWDAFVREATDRYGLKVIPYVCYTPQWAASDAGENHWRSPPRDTADFSRFMETLVTRYRGRIHSWQVWNEPDAQSYWIGSTAQFAELVRAGAAAVRRADPTAKVVLGGLAGDVTFLERVLDAPEVFAVIDGVDLHSFFETAHPAPIEQLRAQVSAVETAVRAHGVGKSLWIGEAGYSTRAGSASVSPVYRPRFQDEHTENAQAFALARTFFTAIETGKVSLIAWFRINDLLPPSDRWVDGDDAHFGLRRSTGTAKPALGALAYLARAFGQPFQRVTVRVDPATTDVVEAHAFRLRDQRTLVAVWFPMPDAPAEPQVDTRRLNTRIAVPANGRRVESRDLLGRPVRQAKWERSGDAVVIDVALRGSEVAVFEVRP